MYEIALYKPKTQENLGLILRSCHCFGVTAVNLIGHRYKKRVQTDTMNSSKHIPIYTWDNIEDLLHAKQEMSIIAVEVDGQPINGFKHPEQGLYVFGGEDMNVPQIITERIMIPTSYCLNLAMAVSILCFSRGMT